MIAGGGSLTIISATAFARNGTVLFHRADTDIIPRIGTAKWVCITDGFFTRTTTWVQCATCITHTVRTISRGWGHVSARDATSLGWVTAWGADTITRCNRLTEEIQIMSAAVSVELGQEELEGDGCQWIATEDLKCEGIQWNGLTVCVHLTGDTDTAIDGVVDLHFRTDIHAVFHVGILNRNTKDFFTDQVSQELSDIILNGYASTVAVIRTGFCVAVPGLRKNDHAVSEVCTSFRRRTTGSVIGVVDREITIPGLVVDDSTEVPTAVDAIAVLGTGTLNQSGDAAKGYANTIYAFFAIGAWVGVRAFGAFVLVACRGFQGDAILIGLSFACEAVVVHRAVAGAFGLAASVITDVCVQTVVCVGRRAGLAGVVCHITDLMHGTAVLAIQIGCTCNLGDAVFIRQTGDAWIFDTKGIGIADLTAWTSWTAGDRVALDASILRQFADGFSVGTARTIRVAITGVFQTGGTGVVYAYGVRTAGLSCGTSWTAGDRVTLNALSGGKFAKGFAVGAIRTICVGRTGVVQALGCCVVIVIVVASIWCARVVNDIACGNTNSVERTFQAQVARKVVVAWPILGADIGCNRSIGRVF